MDKDDNIERKRQVIFDRNLPIVDGKREERSNRRIG